MSVTMNLPMDELAAARFLLARLGVKPEQLIGTIAPTFDEYIDHVSQAVSIGTLTVYETYWNRVRAEWGHRRIDDLTAVEIASFAEQMKNRVVQRRNARGGRAAAEHLIGALRCLYRFAVADGVLPQQHNPAAKVAKPLRAPSLRRALHAEQVEQIWHAADQTGHDPDLDTLLLDLHRQTACRRGAALVLRRCDLDEEWCLLRLREKGGTERWQPVTPTLMTRLLEHAAGRGVEQALDHLLRNRNGQPITRRRYDVLWARIGKYVPWVAAQQVSTHWLRYTTLTWVERTFGYAVARAYAGHNDYRNVGSTATYVRADVYEVATALAAYADESHPLAQGGGEGRTVEDANSSGLLYRPFAGLGSEMLRVSNTGE
ncbi:tyrosine-type recombinase/integrase [Catellatospora sichuanensis]|uniref:tyrosine-type recombinase/integrase n=1 Tax=Catellatospora sichuanensis TaxID=1969805 RepID=UPI001FE7E43B|nr:site-specific integrase [Catellatospora sichuanensis]